MAAGTATEPMCIRNLKFLGSPGPLFCAWQPAIQISKQAALCAASNVSFKNTAVIARIALVIAPGFPWSGQLHVLLLKNAFATSRSRCGHGGYNYGIGPPKKK